MKDMLLKKEAPNAEEPKQPAAEGAFLECWYLLLAGLTAPVRGYGHTNNKSTGLSLHRQRTWQAGQLTVE